MPRQQIVEYFRPGIRRENIDRDFVRALPSEIETISDGFKHMPSRLVRKADDKIGAHDDALTLSLQNGGRELVQVDALLDLLKRVRRTAFRRIDEIVTI